MTSSFDHAAQCQLGSDTVGCTHDSIANLLLKYIVMNMLIKKCMLIIIHSYNNLSFVIITMVASCDYHQISHTTAT